MCSLVWCSERTVFLLNVLYHFLIILRQLFLYLLCYTFFFFNETATTEIYTYFHTLPLHDALPILLRPGDCLVFNDTKVIPAQLEGRRGEARVGATLHKRMGLRQWQAFIRNAKRVRTGDRIDFGQGVAAIASERTEDGGIILDFEGDEPVEVLLERAGTMPLPPYIASKRAADGRDREDYQTMFAQREGAVAAPTAALHFTPDLISRLTEAGIATETLTLHVGAGTFLPVKAEDTDDHR